MKLNVRALAVAAGIIWAVILLITAAANFAWGGYGTAFLKLMASVYPGYKASGTIPDLFVGVLYALADGFIFGAVFGWLYNRLLIKRTGGQPASSQQPIEP